MRLVSVNFAAVDLCCRVPLQTMLTQYGVSSMPEMKKPFEELARRINLHGFDPIQVGGVTTASEHCMLSLAKPSRHSVLALFRNVFGTIPSHSSDTVLCPCCRVRQGV